MPKDAKEPSLEQRNARASRTIYSHLLLGEIRRVILRSGGLHDSIRCDLDVLPLESSTRTQLWLDEGEKWDWDDEVSFEALSYVWGSQFNPLDISLEGRKFWVTRNLESALRHLRLLKKDRILWIDALCINQTDGPERNLQVQQMSNIYECSYTTLVWLGPGDSSSDIAMQYLADFESNNCSMEWIIKDDDFLLHVLVIEQLYSRKYWDRLWVMQELAFSRNAVLICGGLHINFFPAVMEFRDIVRRSGFQEGLRARLASCGRAEETAGHSYFLRNVGAARILIQGGQRVNKFPIRDFAMHLFWCMRGRQCIDPRDAVFGLFNMLPDTIAEKLSIDYSLDATDVFIAATSAFITSTHSLDLTTWPKSVETGSAQTWNDLYLPSWVLDLRSNYGAIPYGEKYKDAQLEEHDELTFKIHGKVLHVRGHSFGRIRHIQPYKSARSQAPQAPLRLIELEEFWSWLVGCWNILNEAITGIPPSATKFVETFDAGRGDGPGRILATKLFNASHATAEGNLEQLRAVKVSEMNVDLMSWVGDLHIQLRSRAFVLVDPTDSQELEYGIASMYVEVEDLICLLGNCSVSVVLRPADGGHYYMVGDCYATELSDEETGKSLDLRELVPDPLEWARFEIH